MHFDVFDKDHLLAEGFAAVWAGEGPLPRVDALMPRQVSTLPKNWVAWTLDKNIFARKRQQVYAVLWIRNDLSPDPDPTFQVVLNPDPTLQTRQTKYMVNLIVNNGTAPRLLNQLKNFP